MGQETERDWGRLGEVRDGLGRIRRLVGHVAGAPFEIVLGGACHGNCRISPVPFAGIALPPLRRVPVSTLLARLDGSGNADARRAADLVRQRLAPRATIAFLERTFPVWGGPEVRAFHAGRPAGRRALAIASSVPALGRILPGRVGPLTRRADVLAALGPGGRRAARDQEDRVLSLGWAFEAPETLAALLDLPRDWIPRAPEERAAFDRIARASGALSRLLGTHAALRPSRGRWRDYEAVLERRCDGAGLAAACRTAHDMAGAFARQVAGPELARAGLSRGHEVPYRPEPAVAGAAARVLFGGKGLAAILDAAADWHRRQGEIEVAIGGLGNGLGLSWPPPFDPVAAPDGMDLVPIATVEELRREGAPVAMGGLAHCVGGYGKACSEGRSVVVSIRREGRRLSTLELDLSEATPRVVQHRSVANAPAGRAEARAAEWLIGALIGGTVRISSAWRDPSWRRRERIALGDVCGYDWRDPASCGAVVQAWAPHLPRPLRDGAALSGAIAGQASGCAAGSGRTWRGPLPKRGAPARAGRNRAMAVLRAPFDLAGRISERPGGHPRRILALALAMGPAAACAAAIGPGPLAGPAMAIGWVVSGVAIRRAWAGPAR